MEDTEQPEVHHPAVVETSPGNDATEETPPENTSPKETAGAEDVIECNFEISSLTDELSTLVRAACLLMPPCDVSVSPPGCVLPENYCNYAKRIRQLKVRHDDVWLVSFPKCGSQMAREMLWSLYNNKDSNTEETKSEFHKRFNFLEYVTLWPEGADQTDTISQVEEAPSPRYIRTHLPLELLPAQLWTERPKIIYVGRNPKDAALAYYVHYQKFYQYSGSQEQFFEAFYRDKVVYSPFWEHVLSFWEQRKETNLLFITYEEMSQNMALVLKKTAAFLGVSLEPEVQSKLVDQLKEVKESNEKDAVETNVSKTKRESLVSGKSGQWRTLMTPTLAEKFDKWTKEKLAGTDFSNVFMII